mgnify:CR=1 FL=1
MSIGAEQQVNDHKFADLARKHIDFLAGSIGPRPSCRDGELEAALYAADQLTRIGIDDVQFQEFNGSPTSYGRYTLAVLITAISGYVFTLAPSDLPAGLLALSGILGLVAVMLESDFRHNWTRWIIPSKNSQNVISKIEAAEQSVRDVIVVAHLDTHRTPWFNASRLGQHLFRYFFRVSIILQAAAFASGGAFLLTRWEPTRWAVLIVSAFLNLIGFLLLQADLSGFSPGAYDNASGVGSALSLAARCVRYPMATITLWIVLTGCEETGSAGMHALLKRCAKTWQDPLIINLDQMGSEQLYIRTCEGFLLRRCTDANTLALARESARRAKVALIERESQAYSDAAVALQFGLPAISLGTQPGDPTEDTHRHRLSDLSEHVKSEGLINTQRLCWALLRTIDETTELEGQRD